jgi:hypothetical protein
VSDAARVGSLSEADVPHHRMSLLGSLVDVELIVVDEEQQLVYAWFGGSGVNVFDENGQVVHYFTVGTPDGRTPTPKMVRKAIDRIRADG